MADETGNTYQNTVVPNEVNPKEIIPASETSSGNQPASGIEQKLKKFLSDKYNFIFLGVFIFVLVIRIYYFIITKNQPLWWDESEYMAAAKSYAGIGFYKLSAIRFPGFSLFASIFYIIGIRSDAAIRFFVAFLPSIIAILLGYLCIREMYDDKRIALISLAIFAVLWEHLFYSNRFHTENMSLIFEFLAILVLYRSYIKGKKIGFITPKYSLVWIFLFSIIAVSMRAGNMLFIPPLALFVIILNKSKIFKKKNIPILILIGVILVALILLAIKMFPAFVTSYYHKESPPAWNELGTFQGFFGSVSFPQQTLWYIVFSILYYMFLLGSFLVIIGYVVFYEKIKKLDRNGDDLANKSDFFNLLMILIFMSLMIFIMRSPGYEYRWFFPLLLGIFSFTSKGIITFSSFIGGGLKSKNVVVVIILAITLLGVYNQLLHADNIVKMKVSSYSQVKEAGLWLKENSAKDDLIITASEPQTAFYSERRVMGFYFNKTFNADLNESIFNDAIRSLKPKYLVVSVFEPGFTLKWVYDWPQRHNDTVVPVQAYYLDSQKQQLALVIYKFFYNNSIIYN